MSSVQHVEHTPVVDQLGPARPVGQPQAQSTVNYEKKTSAPRSVTSEGVSEPATEQRNDLEVLRVKTVVEV